MNLGIYTGSLSTSGTTSVSVTCARGTAYSILLGWGNGSGATATNHKVTGPSSNTLIYRMFRNSGRTLNWGQTSGTDSVNATGTGSAQQFPIYPSLAAGQSGPPGTYNDAVIIAVSGNGLYNSTSFTVTATILPGCTITSGNLGFGTYVGATKDVAAVISVKCSNTTPYNVGLNAGSSSGATVTTRKMTGPGSAKLSYALFTNASRTTNWGNTIGTSTVSGRGTGATQGLYVYGRVAAGQLVAPGTYSDTVVVTLSY